MKVYLIRHAQSVENALGLAHHVNQTQFNAFIHETVQAPLSSIGLLQTRRTVRQLRDKGIEHLYTSPFARARCTADVLGRALKLAPEMMPDLGEIMPAHMPESKHITSVRLHYLRGYLLLAVPGSQPENWLALYHRAQRAWRTISQGGGNSVAVVSHYAFIHSLLPNAILQWRGRLHRYDLRNSGVTCLEIH